MSCTPDKDKPCSAPPFESLLAESVPSSELPKCPLKMPVQVVQPYQAKKSAVVYFRWKISSKQPTKLNQRGYFFETRFKAPFKKCLSFLDFLRYCTMGKARAFRKGLFNRSLGAFFFWKELSFVDFHISAFKSTLKATTFSIYYNILLHPSQQQAHYV